MSSTEELLGREKVIRYTGLLLALSPLGNFFSSVILSGVPHWWRLNVLLEFARTITPLFIGISIACLIAGSQMMRGRRSSWVITLCVLGFLILTNLITFKSDLTEGAVQPILSLLINSAFFGLIYRQEFHQRAVQKWKTTQSRLFSRTFTNGPKIGFEGGASWGEIVFISQETLRVRRLSSAIPEGIESRTIEIDLPRSVSIRARFLRREVDQYVFEVIDLTPSLRDKLRRWILTQTRKPEEPGFLRGT